MNLLSELTLTKAKAATLQQAERQSQLDAELSLGQSVKCLQSYLATEGYDNITPLLPGLMRLEGQPYSLHDHFQFEPFFCLREIPPSMIIITGRQTGKTANLSALITLMSVLWPNFKSLIVTPLSDQARRISSDYVGRFLESSPQRKYWIGAGTERAVWRRTTLCDSLIQFSFAGMSVERVRSFVADLNWCDETSDIHLDHLPIIHETMSHKAGIIRYSGTPKTMEGTMQRKWLESSQAEWVTVCQHCNFHNYACTDLHLYRMIGPYHDAIGPDCPGLICARADCRRPIDPRNGYWHHRRPLLASEFPGYHLSQPIMHIHYSQSKKWRDLHMKLEGGSYSPQRVLNEVMGESAGTGVQLVSEQELIAASTLPWENDPQNPQARAANLQRYRFTCLAVDWGGGGESGLSLTVVAVLGITTSGMIHVIWGKRLLNPGHMEQAVELRDIVRMFRCHFLTHDFTGAGSAREALLVAMGVSKKHLIPIAYGSLAGMAFMKVKKPTRERPRRYYLVDKGKSLGLVCHCIRVKKIRFFKHDCKGAHSSGLINDFMALQENTIESARGSGIYTVGRNPNLPDDFAQAVNIGCLSLWQASGTYPDLNLDAALKRALSKIKTTEGDLDSDDLEEEIFGASDEIIDPDDL
jgi:hypothetical protein